MFRKIYFILFIVVSLSFIPSLVFASRLLEVSDKVSSHQISVGASHEITFTSPSGIDSSSDTIEIHFPNEFDLSALTISDFIFSHGVLTGEEISENLASSAGNNIWGLSIDSVSNDIIFTAPSDANLGEIFSNEKIKIKIGFALHQIINPNNSGSYPVYIDGSFGDYGAFALWVGNTSVGITANESTDNISPVVEVLSPNGGESYYKDDIIDIKWSASDNVSVASNGISLYYSINDGLSWVLIDSNLDNTGIYHWQNHNIISTYIKIRVSVKDDVNNVGNDDSDDFFEIKEKVNGMVYNIEDDNDVASYFEEEERIPTIDGSWAYPGDLVKCPEYSTVYFFGFDHYRHYFPNEQIFKTWYYDFSEVKIVNLEDLIKLRLGKNIKVRPGNSLVKVNTYSAVYAVGAKSSLYHIKNEEEAYNLYGDRWQKIIIDIPVVFWGDYKILDSVLDPDFLPDGTLIKYKNDAKVYLLEDQKKRWFVNESAFYSNHYYWKNIIELDQNKYYPDGEDILYRENKLIDLVYDE